MYARTMTQLAQLAVAAVLMVSACAVLLLDGQMWQSAATTLWGLVWTPVSIPIGLPIAIGAWMLSFWEPAARYSRSYFCKGEHRA